MPPDGFGAEWQSLTRWLADTFSGCNVHAATVPAGFARPAFLAESPRATAPAFLPAARRRQVSVTVQYFGHLERDAQQEQLWAPHVLAERMEKALAAIRHRIPLLGPDGTAVGVLATELDGAPRHDTDYQFTFRWRRLVADRQPELEGDIIGQIQYRKVEV